MSELRAVAGRAIFIESTLVRNAVAVDTSAVGFKAWFTLKQSKEDTDAEAVAAKTETAGITLNSPTSVGKNKVTIELDAVDTDQFTESTDLYWALDVDDPASQRGPETIDSGILKLTSAVIRVPA